MDEKEKGRGKEPTTGSITNNAGLTAQINRAVERGLSVPFHGFGSLFFWIVAFL